MPNESASDLSGWTGLAGGNRFAEGSFEFLNDLGFWWTSTLSDSQNAIIRGLNFYSGVVDRNTNPEGGLNSGFSVRCIQDPPDTPDVVTTSASSITSVSALLGGNVLSDGGAPVTARGVVYGNNSLPLLSVDSVAYSGSGMGTYSVPISNLTPSTTYFHRAFATNVVGTGYGVVLNFTTLVPFICQTGPNSTVFDIDSNAYQTVLIDNRCWFRSNLRTSRYRNGTPITTGLSSNTWQTTTAGAYSVYADSSVNNTLFGKLYNFYAATNASGLCPTGWHVSTNSEWASMLTSLGGATIAGNSLKDTLYLPLLQGWQVPSGGVVAHTNSSGFSALPGGLRVTAGNYSSKSSNGYWWSPGNIGSSTYISGRILLFDNSGVTSSSTINANNGFSVRCVKD
jgi:uncharacterized protein (TIGR02145 family)